MPSIAKQNNRALSKRQGLRTLGYFDDLVSWVTRNVGVGGKAAATQQATHRLGQQLFGDHVILQVEGNKAVDEACGTISKILVALDSYTGEWSREQGFRGGHKSGTLNLCRYQLC